MATASNLRPGDSVLFYGMTCTVVSIFRGSEIIGIKYDGDKGFVSYIHARDCYKRG